MKTFRNIVQDKVTLPLRLLENSVFRAWILLEFYVHKPARTTEEETQNINDIYMQMAIYRIRFSDL